MAKKEKKKATYDNPIHLVPKWNHIKRTLKIEIYVYLLKGNQRRRLGGDDTINMLSLKFAISRKRIRECCRYIQTFFNNNSND